MVMYCRKCGKVIAGTKGHAVGKTIAGALLFGTVGAVAGAAHGLAKEGHGEGLCLSCRTYEVEMRVIEAKDRRMDAERRAIEIEDEERKKLYQLMKEHHEAEKRLLAAKAANKVIDARIEANKKDPIRVLFAEYDEKKKLLDTKDKSGMRAFEAKFAAKLRVLEAELEAAEELPDTGGKK